MATSVYTINKGINRPVEFRGLKGQYIWYLGAGLLLLLVLFALLYICGLNSFIYLFMILFAGTVLFAWVYRLSNTYGEHGMMKKAASRGLPSVLKSYSRKLFFKKSS